MKRHPGHAVAAWLASETKKIFQRTVCEALTAQEENAISRWGPPSIRIVTRPNSLGPDTILQLQWGPCILAPRGRRWRRGVRRERPNSLASKRRLGADPQRPHPMVQRSRRGGAPPHAGQAC